MPAVDVAMERSLRGGFLDLLAASLRPALHRRDLAGQITDVRLAFSSWDNCMQATFCKYVGSCFTVFGSDGSDTYLNNLGGLSLPSLLSAA
jgi:hypothetical protein